MASFKSATFGISIAVTLVAIFFGFFRSRTKTFCYSSIKTLSDTTPTANCFTISNNETFEDVFTLDDGAAKKYLQNGHVLPGLWDGHGHLLQYGEMLHSVNLFSLNSIDDAQDRIRKHLREHPDEGSSKQWLRGIGWDQAAFGGIMPTAVLISIPSIS